MALIDIEEEGNDLPSPPKKNPTIEPRQAPTGYNTIATESKSIDSTALTLFMQGSNWSVRYYQQLLKSDNEPSAQDLSLDAVNQQYRQIDKMLLKVSAPLTYTFDNEIKNRAIATGSAGMMALIAPNEGDMFVADVGDGRNGVFAITRASRTTIQKNTVYQIEYQMVSYWNREREADFQRKTIESVVFDPNGWLNGCGPFVQPEEAVKLADLEKRLQELLGDYIADFYSEDQSTFIVPDQYYKTYDHFVTKFVLSLFDVTQDRRLMKVRLLNVSGDRLITTSRTVWDAMVERRTAALRSGIRHASLTDMRKLRGRPELQAIGYMGIPLIVVPMESSSNVEDRYDFEDIPLRSLYPYHVGQERRRDGVNINDPATLLRPEYEHSPSAKETFSQLPMIKPVTTDDYYVFSQSFYERKEGAQSQLEYLVNQAIHREAVDVKAVSRLVESPETWTDLERFYYYPALMYLLVITLRRYNG